MDQTWFSPADLWNRVNFTLGRSQTGVSLVKYRLSNCNYWIRPVPTYVDCGIRWKALCLVRLPWHCRRASMEALAGSSRARRPRRNPYRRHPLRTATSTNPSGDILDGITATITSKYPSRQPGQAWRQATPGCSRRRHGTDEYGSHVVKYFYWFIAVAVAVTALAVLFIPGVDDFVEQTLLGYVGRAVR